MKQLNTYIVEKLKIDKTTGSNLYFKIKDVIKDWLVDHSWFDMDQDDFKIKSENNGDVSLSIPKDSNPWRLIEKIGLKICIYIKEKTKLDVYWSLDRDAGKILFGDSII